MCISRHLVYLFPLAAPGSGRASDHELQFSVLFGATLMFSVIYYRCWAFKTYTGPVIEPRR